MLHDLVYIKYNQQLVQGYNIRDEINFIVLNDIDECNEWLVGQVDDDNDNEREKINWFFDDDPTLNQETVYEASGVGEPITYIRRQTTSKRKQPSSDGIVIGSSNAFKKVQVQLQAQQGKTKKIFKIGVENELHDNSNFEFENLLNFKKSFSKREEERYVSLVNIKDKYVKIEEESNNQKFKTFILYFVVILSFELEICSILI